MTLVEAFAVADQQDAAERLRAAILARIDAIGQAEVARRVAKAWGYDNPRTAESRLSRWRARSKTMSAEALLILVVVLWPREDINTVRKEPS